jgi:imidazolonepropionase-like amidohydrolase
MKRSHALTPFLLLIAIWTAAANAGPEIPGAPQQRPIALVGGTIHTVSGETIVDGTLVFDKGRITAIGKKVAIPAGAEQIDVTGKHVYPGLLDSYTQIGLIEIGAVRATNDHAEAGQINPNVKAQVAVNPDSELIPVTRSNGVLLALSAPTGGLISGRSAVMQLDGWTWEDMTLRGDVGMHVNWPSMSSVSEWWMEQSAKQQMEARDKALETLRQSFDDARAYWKARTAPNSRQPVDARWETMIPVLEGRLPLIVEADEAQQIQAAVAFAAGQKVKLIIYGGYDAPYCADLLKQHNVPVIVAGTYRLPQRRGDDYDAPFTLPDRLRQAGIKFCIAGGGKTSASNVRNLPYDAATAVAYGLPQDEALKAITLYPAQILGVADRVGSLEAGKDATLFIADGDTLETATQVEAAYIQGRPVDLSNRHKRLWQKYQQKYRQLQQQAN